MRRFFFSIAAMLIGAAGLSAYSPEIRDIDISMTLHRDGSASVVERWDVCAADGTEWYLVRKNLGDIDIRDFSVTDESGRRYVNEGEWDVDRSIEDKAGRCGIVHKDDGMELCWGIGKFGDHVFTVSYTMTNAVKSLNDYDMLHLQIVSPGLSSRPDHVKAEIGIEGAQIDSTNTRLWGFGFEGEASMEGGKAVYESSERFRSNSSVIVLLRFDKGTFDSPSRQARDFSEVLDKALEGSDYTEDEDEGGWFGFALVILTGIGMTIIAFLASAANKRKILGMKPKDVSWSREIPFNGNLSESFYTLQKLGEDHSYGITLASALILRMIYKNILTVTKSGSKVELSFSGTAPDESDKAMTGLYKMMLEASGSDRILQSKEFSKWSSSHISKVNSWIKSNTADGRKSLAADSFIKGSTYTPSGQSEARKLLGLKKFLLDFTLIKEKEAVEAVLWKEYLVFGALYGIAETVAKQLKDINPQLLEQEDGGFDYATLYLILRLNDSLSRSITNASMDAEARTGGFGGGTSFGGGGGFSGGGAGGGSR